MFNVITFDFTKNTQFIKINEDYLEQRAVLLKEGIRDFLHPFSTRPSLPLFAYTPRAEREWCLPSCSHTWINLNSLLLARPAPFSIGSPKSIPWETLVVLVGGAGLLEACRRYQVRGCLSSLLPYKHLPSLRCHWGHEISTSLAVGDDSWSLE